MNRDEVVKTIMVNKLSSSRRKYHIHIVNAKWFPWYDVCTNTLWESDSKREKVESQDFFNKYSNYEFKLVDAGQCE